MEDRESPFLTVDEAARYIRLGKRTVCRALADGSIAFYRVGRLVRIKVCDLDAYLERARVEAAR